MGFYPDSQTFDSVMTDLFGRVLARPELTKQLQDSKSVLQITITEPPFAILVDARTAPVRFVRNGHENARIDAGIRLSADTLHGIWLGKIRLRDAYTSGKVKVEGNPLTALPRLLRFADLFRDAERLYPVVLRQRGLLK